jgi:hypothetical protein
MKHIENFGNFGPINEELDADLEKKRDAYFKKLEAVSAAIRDLHKSDGLFELDKGAKKAYDEYMASLEKNNEPWKKLYRYVKGGSDAPPVLAAPKLPPGAKPPVAPMPVGAKPPVTGKPPVILPPPVAKK